MKTQKEIVYTESSGNIFADLGLADETPTLVLRTNLIIKLGKVMKKKKLSQARVAEICGTDQPTVSKVLRGNVEIVSLDRIVTWLLKLGMTFEINIKEHNPDDIAPQVRVCECI